MAIEALYLHIPFCHAKCAYCDFDSRGLCGEALERASARYLDALCRRIEAVGRVGALVAVRTVYVGGGTPTVLGARLAELAARIRRWCAPEEFTCEANPESFTPDLAAALRTAGVTRVSLGVQSLNDAELGALGRLHSAQEAIDAVAIARERGFSVSCDLMCGLPGQTAQSWDDTLHRLVAAAPDHVSVYPLTVEEGTPLAERVRREPSLEPDEDFQADCMERARIELERAGFAPYEVASYARPGHACRHNIAYWSGASYLGIGRSAASMVKASELDGLRGLFPGVVAAPNVERVRIVQRDDEGGAFDFEGLNEGEAVAEDLMLGMRMTSGVPASLLKRAYRLFGEDARQAVVKALDEGLARLDTETSALVPTDRGWLMGNELYGLMWGLADVRAS